MNKQGTELKYTRYSPEFLSRNNLTCDVLKVNQMKCGRSAVARILEITDQLEERNINMQGENICSSHLTIAEAFANAFKITTTEEEEDVPNDPSYAYANFY